VDLGAPRGTPIFASADGVVVQANTSGSFGRVIRIDHGNGLETLYAHNDQNLVSVGETVVQGQQIGTVGRTGNATGYHVHFEVRVNGRAQNPMNFI
jgi:murein DD-endopeptidase MepM/ murein hydrolase activator NlpD